MPMKRSTRRQMVARLRQIEGDIAKGRTIPQACRKAQITPRTFYLWQTEFGRANLDKAKRLKKLEKENAQLKRLVAKLLVRNTF